MPNSTRGFGRVRVYALSVIDIARAAEGLRREAFESPGLGVRI